MSNQRFICVWFDDENNRSNDCFYMQDELETIVDSFRIFDNIDRCIDYIIKKKTDKIIFITPNENIIRKIHSYKQIHSTFILNSNVDILCRKIKETVAPSKTNLNGILFVSTIDVKRQDPTFMYSQLLKDILLNDDLDEDEDETKREMIEYCREIYSTDTNVLKILDEFEEHFLSELAIYWYSRESFLYKILNRALWTTQPDILYKLRYFLRKLHEQIADQAKLQYNRSTTFIVYRGQNMSSEQVEKLKTNLGGFLSFNNFLSTSLRRQTARSFLVGSEIGVLFEIYIDTKIRKFPFANIEHLSFQQGKSNESEVLFSMGTVFRMIGMDTEKHFHRVQLMLTDDIDQQLEQYTKTTRDKAESTHSFLSLLKLMYELKQYTSVDCFARMFNRKEYLIIDEELHDEIYKLLGLTCYHRGHFKNALEYLNKSLNICLSAYSDNHSKLSSIYYHLGSAYLAQGNADTAIANYELAADCSMNAILDGEDPSFVVKCLMGIATLIYEAGAYSEALESYQAVLSTQLEYLDENDQSLVETYNMLSATCSKLQDYEAATSYHNKSVELQKNSSEMNPEASAQCAITSGLLCISQKQYNEALDHFKCALQIQQQYFLSNNPELASTYDLIANVYYEQNQYDQSLSNHMKVLDILVNSLADDHPSIGGSYFDISKDYVGLMSWSNALEYGFKAIEQARKSVQMSIEILLICIDHIAEIYCQMNEYKKALIHYQEALDLCLNYLPDDDSLLINRYDSIGETYLKLEKYNRALKAYQKKLNIQLEISSNDMKSISTTYLNIAISYFHLDQLDEALIAGNQAQNYVPENMPVNDPHARKIRDILRRINRAM